MNLNHNEKEILDYLSDGEWHCMASPYFYQKDDRARISSLNKKGYVVVGVPCTFHKHDSMRLKMRKLTQIPDTPPKECCYSFGVFQTHSPDCVVRKTEKVRKAAHTLF